MKKLLGTTLALAMFVPAGANAELLKNFKLGGQLDVQTTSVRNASDFVTRQKSDLGGPVGAVNNDRIGSAMTRLILRGDWDVLDDVHAHVALVKGAHNNGAAAGNRAYGSGAEQLQQWQERTWVTEANVKIDKLFGLLDTTIGRQTYGEEGDLIIYYGARDNYGLRMDAVDLFRADWNGEHMSVTGIAGKTAGGANTVTPADTDLRGIAVSCKMHEMVKPTLYVYNSVRHATGALGATSNGVNGVLSGKNTNLWIAGAKVKVTSGGLTASGELAINRGEDRTTAEYTSFKGWAFQAKAAYKADVNNVGMITPWGEYGYGTGDSNGGYAGNRTFQAINTDYRPGGIYGRFDNGALLQLGATGGAAAANANVSSNGLSNRIIWGIGLKVTPTSLNKLTAGAAFYRYAFNRLADNANGAGTNNPTRNSRNIGSEVDVTAEWKHSENVSLKATAGSFKPGAGIADIKGANAALNPVVMLAGDVSIKF